MSDRILGRPMITERRPLRLYVYGGTDRIVPKKTRPDAPPCSVAGCAEQSHARTLCPHHYYELVRKTQ